MYHLCQSHNPTPLSTFLRGRTPSRLWSWYRQEKTHKKLNNCGRMTTTTMTMRRKKEEGNKTEGKDDEDYTPLSDVEKDEMFHDTNDIKTAGNEALIPTGRLRDLLSHLNITTHPEFRIKRVPCHGWEEYKEIVEIFSGPNVLSRHKGPAFRATYQDAVANAA
jgi:hypothetical protein